MFFDVFSRLLQWRFWFQIWSVQRGFPAAHGEIQLGNSAVILPLSCFLIFLLLPLSSFSFSLSSFSPFCDLHRRFFLVDAPTATGVNLVVAAMAAGSSWWLQLLGFSLLLSLFFVFIFFISAGVLLCIFPTSILGGCSHGSRRWFSMVVTLRFSFYLFIYR